MRGVNKISNHYAHHGTLFPFCRGGSEADVVAEDVLNCIEIWKLPRPSIYVREVQNRLLLGGSVIEINFHQYRQLRKVSEES